MVENTLKELCPCCEDGLKLTQIPDTYICPICRHIYRHYHLSASDYHSEGGNYRSGDTQSQGEKEYDEITKTFNTFSLEKASARIEKVKAQISHISKFLSKDQTALEIASGKGFMLHEAKEIFKKIVGNDIHPSVGNHNKKYNPEVDFIVCDALELSEEDKYDVVLAFDVLEHIEDANKFVEKMWALTKEYVVVQVPVDRSMSPPNPNFDGHVHYFSKDSLRKLFTKKLLFRCEYIYKSKRGELANGPELIAVFKKI